MTNQEDIEILEELRSYFGDKALLKNDDESAHIHNALLDAIKIVKGLNKSSWKALEQQPKTIQEKQAESEKYEKAFDDGYENGYAQARFDYEQQPCEDCVSREEVIRIAEQGQIQGYEWQFKKLCNLPSVTPQRPKGKWNFIGYQMFECSSCKSAYTQNQFEELRLYTTDDLLPKYCPNCGSHNGGEENGNSN